MGGMTDGSFPGNNCLGAASCLVRDERVCLEGASGEFTASLYDMGVCFGLCINDDTDDSETESSAGIDEAAAMLLDNADEDAVMLLLESTGS